MLAALTNVLLAFENKVGKLIPDFESEKLQQGEAKEQVDFDVFVKFGLRNGTLHEIGQKLAEGGMVRSLNGAEFRAGDVGTFGVLANEVKQIFASGLDEPGAQEYVVVNVIHADGQRAHRNGAVIALEFRRWCVCLAGNENAVDHDLAGRAVLNVAAAAGRGKNWRADGG